MHEIWCEGLGYSVKDCVTGVCEDLVCGFELGCEGIVSW